MAKTQYTPVIVLPSDIGPYRIHERLGAGGMGEVYRAYDSRLERWVAIKVVRAAEEDEDSAHRSAARERFRREARAVAGLSHPGVVQIYDILERDEGDCIVMELVEGETLAQVIRRQRLPLRRTVEIGREVAEGLAAAHAKGVIHRDLKAENVMITTDGRAKILDFGLAKRLGPEAHDLTLSGHGRILGTSHAMSPEQAQGLVVDHRSDLFSLGSLLYELATGQAPFRREALAQTLIWVCTRDPTPAYRVAPAVPPLLSELIDHLLQKEPNDRPESATQVAEVLRHLERELEGPGGSAVHASGPVHAGLDDDASAEHTVPTLLAIPRPAYGARQSAVAATGGADRDAPHTPWPGRRTGTAPVRRRRWRTWGVIAVLVLVLAGAGIAILAGTETKSVYVAVPSPTVTADDRVASRELLPSAVRVAVLQELLSLEGVTALAPDQVDAFAGGSTTELARALAADEVVTTRLDCQAAGCQATLSRVRGTDGALLWTQIFEVPSDDLLKLSRAVGDRLRRAYGDRSLRRESDRLAVNGGDYERYLRLREAFRTRLQGADLGDLLQRITAVRRSSPGFMAAYLLEARIARARFSEESRDEADLDRAFDAIQEARRLAPDDPEPLFALVETALAAGRLERADEALRELDMLQPGDLEVKAQRAVVLEHRGRPEDALALMRSVVAERPSERNLVRLATIELHQGEVTSARNHLNELLQRAPDSFQGRFVLAQLELVNGSPKRAAALFEELLRRSPGNAVRTNLGVAYMLLGRYEQAAESFRALLESDQRSPFTTLNLADAELLAGHTARAQELYRELLKITAADPAQSDWQIVSARAQALAHLGSDTEAVATIQRALQLAPENAQAAFEAAVVYAVVGERRSTLVNARRALQLGFEPVWFQFPWFDGFRDDPELGSLLQGSPDPARPTREPAAPG